MLYAHISTFPMTSYLHSVENSAIPFSKEAAIPWIASYVDYFNVFLVCILLILINIFAVLIISLLVQNLKSNKNTGTKKTKNENKAE